MAGFLNLKAKLDFRPFRLQFQEKETSQGENMHLKTGFQHVSNMFAPIFTLLPKEMISLKFGATPHPVTDTTRIMNILSRESHPKPSFVTSKHPDWGCPDQRYICPTFQEKGPLPTSNPIPGGAFKYVSFSSLLGEMIQVDEHIFQMGWNPQLAIP